MSAANAKRLRDLVLDGLLAGHTCFPDFAGRLATLNATTGRFDERLDDVTILDEVDRLFREGYLGWGCSLTGLAMGGTSMAGPPYFRVTALGRQLLARHEARRLREKEERERRGAKEVKEAEQ